MAIEDFIMLADGDFSTVKKDENSFGVSIDFVNENRRCLDVELVLG